VYPTFNSIMNYLDWVFPVIFFPIILILGIFRKIYDSFFGRRG
jgi:hypothetical protein